MHPLPTTPVLPVHAAAWLRGHAVVELAGYTT
jgi:hypothetical protein